MEYKTLEELKCDEIGIVVKNVHPQHIGKLIIRFDRDNDTKYIIINDLIQFGSSGREAKLGVYAQSTAKHHMVRVVALPLNEVLPKSEELREYVLGKI